jgi:formylglycine-generating enzyme
LKASARVVALFAQSLSAACIGDHKPPSFFLDGPRQPVVDVNWFEALAYASLHGGRLPTEWEWECAARVIPGSKSLRAYATPSGRLTKAEVHYDEGATVDVDDPKYPALPNGLRHMTGNVLEWMQNYYCAYPEGPITNPTSPLEGDSRALRGGSWDSRDPQCLHAAARYGCPPDFSGDAIGFRVVVPFRNADV